MPKNYVLPIPLTAFNSAALNGTYQLLSAAAGLPRACFLVRILNDSDVPVLVSYDGTTDHDYVAPMSILQINFQTNSQPSGYVALIAKGTHIYIKGISGSGSIRLAAYYSPNN